MFRARLSGVLGSAVLVAACACAAVEGPEQPDGPSWAREAEAWIAGYDSAAARDETEGVPGAVLYYAPDVLLEVRGQFPAEGFYGRAEIALRDYSFAHTSTQHTFGDPYLDRTGFVRTEALVWAEPGRRPLATLRAWEVEPEGIVTMRTFDWLEAQVVRDNPAFEEARTTATRLARAYVDAWSGADHASLRRLYGEGATVDDTLLGVAVTGREAIVALADPQTAVPARLETAGDHYDADVVPPTAAAEAPAVYLSWRFERPDVTHPARVLILTRSIEACPGATAVELTLDRAGLVVAERRFHELTSLRTCLQAGEAADGWWNGRGLPTPLSERVTGRVESPSGPIEIRNGTPELEQLVRWGLERYAAASMSAPAVERIAFDPFDARCRGIGGYTTSSASGAAILICADAAELALLPPKEDPVCDDRECRSARSSDRVLLLHELAHAWVATRLDGRSLARFSDHVAAAGWADEARPATGHPTEQAAVALAWGVAGGRGEPTDPGSPSCDVVARGFEILTGRPALTACP